MDAEFIFVYGSLRKTVQTTMSAELARYSEYVGEATLQGKLYQVHDYLAAIESSNAADKVHGEVHRILDVHALLPLLDDYEECSEQFPLPHEYIRTRLPVTLNNGCLITAWVYIYNHDISHSSLADNAKQTDTTP